MLGNQMHRRTFLMGLGKFAGAALILPTLPTIFDMGRSNLVLPEIPTLWDPSLLERTRPLVSTSLDGSLPTVLSRFYLFDEERSRLVRKDADDYYAYLHAELNKIGWDRPARTGEQLADELRLVTAFT